jgi:hypothetical protein
MEGAGVPANQLERVNFGARLSLGVFDISVLPARHEFVPGFTPGLANAALTPPLKARDYRLDEYYCYRIQAGSISLTTDPGLKPAAAGKSDVLFVQPHRSKEYYSGLLARIQPGLVAPIHWDSLFANSTEPRHSYIRAQWAWPPLKGVNLKKWAEMIAEMSPRTRVLIPRRFEQYAAY